MLGSSKSEDPSLFCMPVCTDHFDFDYRDAHEKGLENLQILPKFRSAEILETFVFRLGQKSYQQMISRNFH